VAKKGLVVERLLVVLAIAVRASAVLVLQSHTVPRSTYEHGEIAANLLAGRGFSMHFLGSDGPTSQQAPVYPALVALAFAIGGVDSPKSLLILELGQSLLGGVLVLGVLRLCRGVAPDEPRLGWLAGSIVAIHPTMIYAATHVQVALLGTTALVWALAQAYQAGTSRRVRDALITGGLLALLALVDPILSLGAIGIFSAVWVGQDNRPKATSATCRLVAIVLLAATAGVLPWLIRNAFVHKEFVAIKSTFGYAFWQGNCAVSEGTDKVVRPSVERAVARCGAESTLSGFNRAIWEARHEAGYLDDIALSQDDRKWLGTFSEPERSRILFRRAIADLRDDPARYGWLCWRRLRYFLLFDETNPKSRVLAYRLPHVALTVLAALGLLMAGPSVRRRLAPTVWTTLAITTFHALTIVSARFHVPVEPLMAVWIAAGASRMLGLGTAGALPSSRDDIERIGVVNGFGVLCGNRLQLLYRADVHASQDQSGEHGANADHRRRSPGYSRNRIVKRRRLVGDGGQPGR
jgi:hypothetical protein